MAKQSEAERLFQAALARKEITNATNGPQAPPSGPAAGTGAQALVDAINAASRYASGFEAADQAIAKAGWLAGYTGTESSDRAQRIYNEAYDAGRKARQRITAIEGRQPPPGGSGRVIVEDHFNVPHSGNDGGPFCRFGQVWYDYDAGNFLLGLEFTSGARFIYPNQRFPSAQQVIASVMGYRSMSWATNPKSPYFDARFGKGNYQRV